MCLGYSLQNITYCVVYYNYENVIYPCTSSPDIRKISYYGVQQYACYKKNNISYTYYYVKRSTYISI